MKKRFHGFYLPGREQLEKLWKDCIFVIDANVFLDLYRYNSDAQNDLLKLLRLIRDRIWIPHQSALEFQENRPKVIAEQVNKYGEVRNALEKSKEELGNKLDSLQLKKRHSRINPEGLMSKIESCINEFNSELEILKNNHPDVNDRDKLRDEIDDIVGDKVGPTPESQKELDDIYEEGKIRYKQKRAPGYMDAKKSQDAEEGYSYEGLFFKKEYGDLILWKEILKEAKSREDFKRIILITSESKEDWWLKERGRTIGPKPELVEEIRSVSGVEIFHIYNTESFVEFARKYFKVDIKDESIEQIRDISKEERKWLSHLPPEQVERLTWSAEDAKKWLSPLTPEQVERLTWRAEDARKYLSSLTPEQAEKFTWRAEDLRKWLPLTPEQAEKLTWRAEDFRKWLPLTPEQAEKLTWKPKEEDSE